MEWHDPGCKVACEKFHSILFDYSSLALPTTNNHHHHTQTTRRCPCRPWMTEPTPFIREGKEAHHHQNHCRSRPPATGAAASRSLGG